MKYLIQLLILLYSVTSSAQILFEGRAVEAGTENGVPFALIKDLNSGSEVSADLNGYFKMQIQKLPVDIEVSALSYKTTQLTSSSLPLQVNLEQDPLLLEGVVVTDYHNKTNLLKAKSAISIYKNVAESSIEGIAGLIDNVPGVFIDGSLGEVYTRVYTRGISASAEDDIGWYYQSLQEDGLPITAIQYNYFTPDFFLRSDLMTGQMEAIRGGKSGILFQNSPAGTFNFITQPANYSGGQIKTTLGLLGEANPYIRVDGQMAIPISSNNWNLSLGGFYRYDKGHRNIDYAFNKGGQIRLNLQKVLKNGIFSIMGKYLNDHVNRYTGMSAVNWEKPEAAFDQNFNYTALMLPKLNSSVPGPSGYDFNSADGIHVNDFHIQPNLSLNISGWEIDAKLKYSIKQANWNSSFANQPLGLENFLGYFLSGGQFPFGAVSFTDVVSNETVAVVNNFGALAAFQGEQPSFEYLQGSLPNDALMGIAPWKKDDKLSEFISQVDFSRQLGSQDIDFGLFASQSSLDYFTNASYAYSTFETEPRLLSASVTDQEGNTVQISDAMGLSNLGGLFFESGHFDVGQFALFINDNIQINDELSIEAGLRFENISHKGELDVPAPIEQEGGLDGNPITDYDNGQLAASGLQESIDFNYNYISFSGAIGYNIADNQQIFGRYSRSNKAPELNNYIQNFSGLPLTEPGEVQSIKQLEASYKMSSKYFGLTLTAFNSSLNNVAVSDFVFDQQTNEIYYAPIQLNSTNTVGLELEWTYKLSDYLRLHGSQTVQSSEATEFTIYNTNGSADTSDDSTDDFSGNKLAHIPALMSNIQLDVLLNKLKANIAWQYMGEREGNAENSFSLGAYSKFNINLNYNLNRHIDLSFQVNNVLNSAGLINFFGPNEFGSSANAASAEFIQSNPNASFVVFPILPRAMYFSASLKF